MNLTIPSFVKPFLWSFDTNKLVKNEDKRRIITNVLNLGTKEATDWLFQTFETDAIKDTITHPIPGEWNKKYLNFWSLILNVKPGNTKKIIPN